MIALCLIPLALAFILYLKSDDITRTELIAYVLAVIGITAMIYFAVVRWKGADTEIWNGQLTAKQRQQIHCEHSYPCHCRPMSCGKNCTTTVCDICYSHPYDIAWRLHTNIGDSYRIPSPGQGLAEPNRWTIAKVGEPVASEHSYFNYFKLSQYGLYSSYIAKSTAPSRPEVYDYYRFNHLLAVGNAPIDPALKTGIDDINGRLGPSKQCNILLTVVADKQPGYINDVEGSWKGFKKNDIMIVLNVVDSTITWCEVRALTDHTDYYAELKSALEGHSIKDSAYVLSSIEDTTRRFYIRKRLRDFSYLDTMITLPTSTKIWIIIGMILVTLGLGYLLNNNNIHTEKVEKKLRKRYYNPWRD